MAHGSPSPIRSHNIPKMTNQLRFTIHSSRRSVGVPVISFCAFSPIYFLLFRLNITSNSSFYLFSFIFYFLLFVCIRSVSHCVPAAACSVARNRPLHTDRFIYIYVNKLCSACVCLFRSFFLSLSLWPRARENAKRMSSFVNSSCGCVVVESSTGYK